ncbi:MAG: ATP-binding protein [Bacteroidales bacterium]|nr:ATP-binding protein [Bacteroidales bacterium]
MIVNFNIKNFGSVKKQQTLSFEAEKTKHLEDFYISKIKNLRLLKIALIYGANASGKTTILKALDFLRQLVIEPAEKKTEQLDFKPFLFDKNTPKESTILSIDFIQNDIRYFYEVEFNQKAIVQEVLKFSNPNRATVFTRTTDLKNQFTEIKFGGKIKVEKTALKTLEANTLWNNTVLGGYLKTNVEIKEIKEVSDWFKDYLHRLIYPNSRLAMFITSLIDQNKIKKENVLTILRKADLNISDILIEKKEEDIPEGVLEFIEKLSDKPDEELEKMKSKKKITAVKLDLEHLINGNKYSLPFDLESQGTKRYYAFAGLLNLLIKGQNAFPIDELGASLHPDLYQHFLLSFLANTKNSQIIATTHNREILNDKDLIRDDAIWITDKSKDASTELYSFADFDTSVIRDTTNRLNAYKSGKLGGTPNVGDYYLDLE